MVAVFVSNSKDTLFFPFAVLFLYPSSSNIFDNSCFTMKAPPFFNCFMLISLVYCMYSFKTGSTYPDQSKLVFSLIFFSLKEYIIISSIVEQFFSFLITLSVFKFSETHFTSELNSLTVFFFVIFAYTFSKCNRYCCMFTSLTILCWHRLAHHLF